MKNTCLIILDGWGHAPTSHTNAITQANTPNWDNIWQNNPHTLLSASGEDVGLPKNVMGNSEVGHLNIGAGRLIRQTLSTINFEIDSGEFERKINEAALFEMLKTTGGNLHILALVSDGGIHSHISHITKLCDIANSHQQPTYLHSFTDGRDASPHSGVNFIGELATRYSGSHIKLASICGRYYAMDRDNRAERTQSCYDMLFGVAKNNGTNPIDIIKNSYEKNITDEFIEPTIITPDFMPIGENDVVVFMNFRADRARQLTNLLITGKTKPHKLITLTEYEPNLPVIVLYKNNKITNNMGEYLSKIGLKQLRIAETEKYAHITFFFNGGEDIVYDGEETILVHSPKVATYDLAPMMSAVEITDKLVEQINLQKFDFILCNFANADMVGHTGDLQSAIKAIETLDICLGRIISAITNTKGMAFITADHGNAEEMENSQTHSPSTQHSLNKVPFVYVGSKSLPSFKNTGNLYEIAPTILRAMGQERPSEMTGDLFDI